MAAKALTLGVAAVVILPLVALLGVATLISPSAAGSAGCLWEQESASPTGALEVSGEIPDSLTTQNAHGETVTLSKLQLQRAAAIIAVGKSQNIPCWRSCRTRAPTRSPPTSPTTATAATTTRSASSSNGPPGDGAPSST